MSYIEVQEAIGAPCNKFIGMTDALLLTPRECMRCGHDKSHHLNLFERIFKHFRIA